MTQESLFYTPPTLSPFMQRCEELGIKAHNKESIKVKGITVTTPFIAELGDVHATSEESERDAVLKLCTALKIQFERA